MRIRSVEIEHVFTDDHILCADLIINGQPFTLYFCGWEGLAAAKYAMSSPQAMADLKEMVKQQMKDNAELAAEMEAENDQTA